MMELTQDKLKELISYNEETGVFTWLGRSVALFSHCKNPIRMCNTWNGKYAGKVAGYKTKKKSTNCISIALGKTKTGNVKKYQAHRLAWLYVTGSFPNKDIDHIDGNGMNNAWKNLRCVNNQENHKNVKKHRDNTSGHTGISWNKKQLYWDVRVQLNGKPVYRGRFIDIEDAIIARDRAWKEYGFHENHGRGC